MDQVPDQGQFVVFVIELYKTVLHHFSFYEVGTKCLYSRWAIGKYGDFSLFVPETQVKLSASADIMDFPLEY